MVIKSLGSLIVCVEFVFNALSTLIILYWVLLFNANYQRAEKSSTHQQFQIWKVQFLLTGTPYDPYYFVIVQSRIYGLIQGFLRVFFNKSYVNLHSLFEHINTSILLQNCTKNDF
jgi:hypothetical protein